MQIYSFLSFDGIFLQKKIQQLNCKADSPIAVGVVHFVPSPTLNLSISSTRGHGDTDFYRTQILQKSQIFTDLLEISMADNQ